MLLRSITLGVWFFLGSAVAQTSFNITTSQIDPSTCVAPSDYTTCFELAVKAEDECINSTANAAAQNGCGCGGFIEQMNCFAGACWNRIYGCEYQSLVAGYVALCEIMTLPVPYWPAPDNAPGSCSCNTGKVIETYLESEASELSCGKNAESLSLGQIPAREEACACCGESMTISGMYDICPNTNPALIGLNVYLNAVAPYYPWPKCVDSLNQNNCVADLGFVAPLSTGALYNANNLPASGTQALSNIPGEVTSPASGSIFSYTAIGQEWTVTALSIDAVDVMTTAKTSAANTGGVGGGNVVTGASTGASTGVSTGVSTGASTGSPTTTAQKSGANKKLVCLSSFLTPAIFHIVVMFL